jgi:hypothetical protein
MSGTENLSRRYEPYLRQAYEYQQADLSPGSLAAQMTIGQILFTVVLASTVLSFIVRPTDVTLIGMVIGITLWLLVGAFLDAGAFLATRHS